MLQFDLHRFLANVRGGWKITIADLSIIPNAEKHSRCIEEFYSVPLLNIVNFFL